jgi:hypothetical protein
MSFISKKSSLKKHANMRPHPDNRNFPVLEAADIMPTENRLLLSGQGHLLANEAGKTICVLASLEGRWLRCLQIHH